MTDRELMQHALDVLDYEAECGKVFTNKRLSEIHNCIREIPMVNYNNV